MQIDAIESIFSSWIGEVEKDLVSRDSLWSPTMITGFQNARTVVLRGFDRRTESGQRQILEFVIHTDVRSQKWQDLKKNSVCCLHFYCGERRWQMRVHASAELFHLDAVSNAAWGGFV